MIFIFLLLRKVAGKAAFGTVYLLSFCALVWKMTDGMFVVAFLGYPFLENVVLLAVVNWTWHSFLDPNDPNNEFVGSITILGGTINVLNEDSHVVHHQYPGVHWSNHTRLMQKHTDEYGKSHRYGSVFKNTHAFEMFFMVILQDFDTLASKFVGFMPEDKDVAALGQNVSQEKLRELHCPMSQVEAAELIKSRLRMCWWGPRSTIPANRSRQILF